VASTTLNVLIHGMFAIEVGDQGITLFPPAMPDNSHVYRAGTWEREEALLPNLQYRLTGVAGRNTRPLLDDLHPDHNAVFQRPSKPIDQNLAFCSIALPFPDRITPLRLKKAAPGQPFFQNPPPNFNQPHYFPSVVALTYQGIGMWPLNWAPVLQNNIANLHFWALPPEASNLAHAHMAFSKLAQMIQYPNVQPNTYYDNAGIPLLDLVPEVEGVCCDEQKTLYERRTPSPGSGEIKFMGSIDCASVFLY
jgi:hypothetical protein